MQLSPELTTSPHCTVWHHHRELGEAVRDCQEGDHHQSCLAVWTDGEQGRGGKERGREEKGREGRGGRGGGRQHHINVHLNGVFTSFGVKFSI